MLTRRAFVKLCLGAGAALATFVGYPLHEAMARPRAVQYRLRPPAWRGGPPLHIVMLADIHACEPWMPRERIAEICRQANALSPDIILLLGDFVAGIQQFVSGTIRPDEWASELSRLRAPLGVHAILGNHDYWHDEAFLADNGVRTQAEIALVDNGIPVYINRAAKLEKDGRQFWLCGLGDQLATTNGIDDLDATLRQTDADAPVLLLAHEPDIFPDVTGRVALTLCGHTHGGQINIFGWKPVVPSRFGSRYAEGHIVEDGKNMIVSRGLGCTGLPVRFGAWPEITEVFIE